jgi:hypothetical protein
MRNRLEEELAAGMRERVSHLRPSDDLVARAAHRHRRRRARLAAGSAAVGVSAVLVLAVVGLNAGPAARTGPTDASGATPQLLTAMQVSQRVAATLDGDDIKYAVVTTAHGPTTVRTQHWQDPVTGTSRRSGVNYPGGPNEDIWVIVGESGVVVTQVNRTARTWWRFERPGPTELPSDPTTPEQLRQALLNSPSAYELVGHEEIDGHAVVHLRSTHKGGTEDLWVDAKAYRPVRLVIVKPGDGTTIRRQEDIQWLPRNSASLAPLTVAVPAGFARLDVSAVPAPSPR